MAFHFMTMTEEHAVQISGWRYELPYNLYDSPDWDWMLATGFEFADPELRSRQYTSVLDETGVLVGYAQFFPLLGVTRLGLGLRPDLCGRGIGPAFVRAVAEEAIRRNPDDEIDLEVLVWNERARKAYERAGFSVTDTYTRKTPEGMAEFHCMVYSKP